MMLGFVLSGCHKLCHLDMRNFLWVSFDDRASRAEQGHEYVIVIGFLIRY